VKEGYYSHRKVAGALQTVLAIIVTLIMIFPLYWMLITSFKTTDEVLLTTPTFFPQKFTFEAYEQVMSHYPVWQYLLNTLIVTTATVFLQVFFGILAAYAFSKGNFWGKNVLFILVLGAMMIPIHVTFIPTYVMISRAGWLNSYQGLIIAEALSAYNIFLLRQSFMTVDNSYLEAAKVDGLGSFRMIFQILTPMCRPTVITMTILAFINGWNAYFWPKMIVTTDRVRTISVGIADIRNSFLSMEALNMNQITAASCVAVLPILVLFIVFQKYILTGFSKAAMK